MRDRGIIGNFIISFLSIFIPGAILYCFILGDRNIRKFMVETFIIISILAALYTLLKSTLTIKSSENVEEIDKAKRCLINITKVIFPLIIIIPIIWVYVI